MSSEMRGSGFMRALLRTTACIAVLTPVALLVAASVGAVTITSAGTTGSATSGGGITNRNVATASDEPYCTGTIFAIQGEGFAWEGGIKSVTMGGVPAMYVQPGSDRLIFAMLGPGATTGPIVIVTGNGTTFSTDSLPGGRLNQGDTSIQGQKAGIQVMDCPSH